MFFLHPILSDGVIFQIPNAPKRMRRDDTGDDAIVPEIDPQAEDTENKFTNGK